MNWTDIAQLNMFLGGKHEQATEELSRIRMNSEETTPKWPHKKPLKFQSDIKLSFKKPNRPRQIKPFPHKIPLKTPPPMIQGINESIIFELPEDEGKSYFFTKTGMAMIPTKMKTRKRFLSQI